MFNGFKTKLTFSAGAVAFFCYTSTVAAAIPESQQAALRAIYIEAEGQNWNESVQQGWSATGEVTCTGDLIVCDELDNVTRLVLVAMPRSTTSVLSSKISALTELEYLSLLAPGMSTPLPQSLTTLPKLKTLNIDTYEHEGPIPDWFGDFPALERLELSFSSFSGPLPESLGNLSTLKDLYMPANDNLDGPIPESLGNLINLERLILAQSQLEGTIPASLGNLTNLTHLDLSYNRLEGDVPSALYNHPNLDFEVAAPEPAGIVRGNALYTADPATISSPIYSQLTPVEQAHDAKVTAISYLGGEQASIEWQVYDWHRNIVLTRSLNNDNYVSHGYVIYARIPGREWTKVTTINDSDIKTWQGSVPGLSDTQSIEIQVRRTIGVTATALPTSTRELAESSGTQAPVTMIDVMQTPNNPPSFISQGDALNNAPASFVEIPAWASNLNDGDGSTQSLTFELKYLSHASLFNGVPHISVPSGTLRFSTASEAAGESLVVFELCDKPSNVNQARACSAQKVFKIGVDNTAVAVPDFQVTASVSTTSSERQEHTAWATGMHDGSGNTTSSLLFETLWIENSELFEINPWISTPSGSLRFQFKDGVSGQSTIYVHFRDYTTGMTSAVKSFTLVKNPEEVAPNTAASTANSSNNGGVAGQSSDRFSSQGTEGGGGSFGFLLLSLGLLRLRRSRTI